MKQKVFVYHGSERIVESPRFGQGSPKNDYGYGFYCTQDKNAACIWANRSGTFGYCNGYEVNQKGLNVLDLSSLDAMYWISLLLEHRTLDEMDQKRYKDLLKDFFKTYPISLEGIDVVIGYRADDRYFRYCKDFLGSQLDYDSLTKALRLGKLGMQYVLISPKAFQRVHFVEAKKIPEDYLHSYSKLLREANDDYQEIMERVDQRNGTFIREKLYGKR